jgi:tetratricopeptide (TPR) repeat protein
VRGSPRSAGYRAVLGDARRQLGDADGAVAAYREAGALDPDEPLAQVGLLWTAARAGDVASAERHAARALAGAPPGADTWVRVGLVWEEAGLHPRALEAYRGAVAADGGHRLAQILLAAALLRAGREAEAEPHLRAAGSLAQEPRFARRLEAARRAAASAGRAG